MNSSLNNEHLELIESRLNRKHKFDELNRSLNTRDITGAYPLMRDTKQTSNTMSIEDIEGSKPAAFWKIK